jgi:hypothetical protein
MSGQVTENVRMSRLNNLLKKAPLADYNNPVPTDPALADSAE